jgi:TonB family protein
MMILAWLTYCVLVASLLGVAAWAAETASRAWGWLGRWWWAGSLAGSLALPAWAWFRPVAEAPSGGGVVLPGAYVMDALPALAVSPAESSGPSLELMFVAAWAATSLVLLLFLAFSGLRVRAAGRRWRRGEVDGVPVLVSERTGPAALGLLRGAVVLPEWALALDERLRRLLVWHEVEHVRARDPQLAVAGLVACVLMPWNPVLWWQLARLRLAIELDCDARVLRRAGDPADYGSLLLEVGQRRSRLAVGLAESRSMLERRLRMMTRKRAGRRVLRAASLGAVSVLVLAVACETPPPTGLADAASQPLPAEQALAEARSMTVRPVVVVVDGVVAGGPEALQAIRPEAVERVDIIRGAVAEAFLREVADFPPDAPASDVILVLTKDASPGAMERTRLMRESVARLRDGAPATDPPVDVAEGPVFTPMTVRPTLTNAREVQRALMDHYPPLLRDAGIGGTVHVWFFLDDEGVVRQARLYRSSGYDALDQAALRVAHIMRFSAAYLRDERVPVWVALPITFEIDSGEHEAEPVRAPPSVPVREGVATGPVFTPMTVRPQLTNAPRVVEALRDHYPPLLRDAGITGTVQVWLHIDVDGRVTDARVHRSSGYEALDRAALRVVEWMEFNAARNREEVVPVWVSLPVTFGSADEED